MTTKPTFIGNFFILITSCGVIFYQLLYGKYPYVAKQENILLQNIKSENVTFDPDV